MKSKTKNMFKIKWVKFFPHKCLLPDVKLNEGVNKLTRRKHFLWQNFILTVWEMSVCRKCKHYPQWFICFTFVLWRVTGYLPLFKKFCMALFGHFSFWAPTCFSEVIRPRYGPDGRYDSFSVSNTHSVKLSTGVINP